MLDDRSKMLLKVLVERYIAGDSSSPVDLASVREPTGWPSAM